MFVQGELTTLEYDRTIRVPAWNGKTIEHTIQKLVVQLRAETIRTLDRSAASDQQSDAAEPPIDEVPY